MCINDLNNIIDTKPKLKRNDDENVFIGLRTFSKNDNYFVIVEDKDGDVYHVDVNDVNICNDIELETNFYEIDR